MNSQKFTLTNRDTGTRKSVTENYLLEMGVDEFIIEEIYETDELTFMFDLEEYKLENPRNFDTYRKMEDC